MKTSNQPNRAKGKRRPYFNLFPSLFLLFLTACIAEKHEPAYTVVQFISTISGNTSVTKASNSSWDNGDAVGIFMVGNRTAEIASDFANKKYTVTVKEDGSGSLTPVSDVIYLPADGSKVDFIAYYPYQEEVGNFTIPINVGGNQQGRLSTIDLLYAATSSTQPDGYDNHAEGGLVAFTFHHRLTKLVLNIQPGDGVSDSDLSEIAATIKGLYAQSAFNLRTGTIATPNEVADIHPHRAGGQRQEAIIVPQTITAGKVTIEFNLSFGPFVYTMEETTFKEATQYTYNVTATRTGLNISCSIEPWVEEDPKNVTAE